MVGYKLNADWVMPRFRDRDICDWGDDISRLKRENRLDEALKLAVGCMDAMAEVAQRNPANVLEHYVIQVVIIQHRLKQYHNEVQTISSWLDRGLPAARADHRLELHKRLAKANELWAKSEGRDPSAFRAEWQHLVTQEKENKKSSEGAARSGLGVSSGRSAARPARNSAASRKPSRLIPSRADLLATAFVAVDFETANRSGGVSACQIALVKMTNGMIVDRFSTLLKPPPGWGRFEFTYLHGIGPKDVARAPSWSDVVTEVSSFVDGVPVYAHNAQFDAQVWRELDAFYATTSEPQQFFCSYRTAKRLIPGLPNYKLPTVVDRCVPQYRLDHHNADSDAEACALIIKALQSTPQLHSRL